MNYSNRRRDYRCTRIATHLRKCIRGSTIQPKAMIQVGVGTTFEAVLIKEWFPPMRIAGMDPVKREAFYPGDLHEFAVSDSDEPVDFYVDRHIESSSVFPIAGKGKTSRLVRGVRLDTFANLFNVDGPVVLWMDCEGSEGKAIEGGSDVLSRTNWVYMECVHSSERKDWPNHEDNQARLVELGFEIYSWPNARRHLDGWKFAGDVIYVRPEVLTKAELGELEVRRKVMHREGISPGHIRKHPGGEETWCDDSEGQVCTFRSEGEAFSESHNELVCGTCLVEARKGLLFAT